MIVFKDKLLPQLKPLIKFFKEKIVKLTTDNKDLATRVTNLETKTKQNAAEIKIVQNSIRELINADKVLTTSIDAVNKKATALESNSIKMKTFPKVVKNTPFYSDAQIDLSFNSVNGAPILAFRTKLHGWWDIGYITLNAANSLRADKDDINCAINKWYFFGKEGAEGYSPKSYGGFAIYNLTRESGEFSYNIVVNAGNTTSVNCIVTKIHN